MGRGLVGMLMVLLVVSLGCRAASTAAPPSPAPAASLACAEDDVTRTLPPAWAGSGAAGPAEMVPLIVSSQVSVGPSRFLFTVMDLAFGVLASDTMPTELRLFALDRDAVNPALETTGTYLDTGTGRGLYRAAVDFPCSGLWGAEVVAIPAAAEPMRARTTFRVTDGGSTPAIGTAAPRSDSLTAVTMAEILAISTDPDPDPEAYRLTVAEAVTSGKPSVIFFATPAFCQSGVCGPTVEMVKGVVADYRSDIEFVNVEPYRLRQTANGLQPELDEQGRLQPVSAVVDYGILVEPYLFVVDASGDIAAKFEVVVGEDELRGALEDVTSR